MEIDIHALQQKNMSVQEFYSAMINIWDQWAFTELNELKACGAYIVRRQEQILVQFLMALHNDFDELRGSILHRTPLPFVDLLVSELLIEETRLKSHFEKGILSTLNPSVLVVPSKPPSNNQNRTSTRTALDECNFYKQKGN